ncbi:MAG: GNAT family N-acetyltransferase [Phycisphaerales bacterium]
MPDPGRPHPAEPAVAAPAGGPADGPAYETPPRQPVAVRVTPELELSAAARLVSDGVGPRANAAKRMLTAAAIHGIDLSLMWATVDAGARQPRVRQVCLAVPGAGRTVMLILSGPEGGEPIAGGEGPTAERVACIRAACDHLEGGREGEGGRSGRDIRIAQALPEPHEPWAVRALVTAGFLKVGDLAYLRRPLARTAPIPEPRWPQGVSVRTIGGAAPGHQDRAALLEALDRSYEETLDCPELCGLRETADILESHRATGQFNPGLWWLVFLDGAAHGCMLLSHCPDHHSVELVYLGLSKELRGRRIGSRLLEMGLGRLAQVPADHMTCAVDLRNAPAMRLYERMGFREFGRRVALVRPVSGRSPGPREEIHNP